MRGRQKERKEKNTCACLNVMTQQNISFSLCFVTIRINIVVAVFGCYDNGGLLIIDSLFYWCIGSLLS